MSPHEQHPILLIDQDQESRLGEPDHVMPVPLTVWQLNIDLPEPHPRTLIDHPFSERPPPARLAAHRISHGIEANVCRTYLEITQSAAPFFGAIFRLAACSSMAAPTAGDWREKHESRARTSNSQSLQQLVPTAKFCARLSFSIGSLSQILRLG
jgi:hypothetical protein